MVALGRYRGDLNGYGAIMEVMHCGNRTILKVVRPCGMGVTPRKALNMYRSPYTTRKRRPI